MRHDTHFVEEVTQRADAIGRLVDIDKLEPNPHQPRQQFGDLSDMVASIKEKGDSRADPRAGSRRASYQIIAGERRYQASVIAGLSACRASRSTSTIAARSRSR